jgi:signal transduction histidine kinase
MYKDKITSLQNALYSQMQITSLKLESKIFNIDYVAKTQDKPLYTMLRDEQNLYGYFKLPGSDTYLTKVSYPVKYLDADIEIIQNDTYTQLLPFLLLTFILSILFAFYTLHPLKKSLEMTNEFIKDILHDFNTPISTIRLNTDLLKEKNTKPVHRIKNSINTILNLQNNLKNYIDDELGESETFDLKQLIHERIDLIQATYPHIIFSKQVQSLMIHCNKDAMSRILDNIFSNACKYNKTDGEVIISLAHDTLHIEDTGVGIRHPKKIFDRFYKETSRGLGIGLHIVKKLSNLMHIEIAVSSTLGKGTTFTLDLSQLTLHSCS